MDAEAAGIWRSDGVEDGWHLLKDSLKRLEGVARDVYSGIGKAQRVRMGRRVTYDNNLRLLKKERTAAKKKLDKRKKPEEQPEEWRAFKRVKNRMKKVAFKNKMLLLEEEAKEI